MVKDAKQKKYTIKNKPLPVTVEEYVKTRVE